MTLALHYALRSDVGLLRPGNEDSAYAGPRLLAIADGMGGHAAGEVASAVAISAIAPLDGQNLTESEAMLDALAGAVASARSTLHDLSVADPSVEGMGTTLTALLWAGAQVAVCHIGDSRAYLLRDGDLYQITRDHTLIQSLVDEGRLSPAAAANHPQRSLIIRALQSSTDADPDLGMHEALLGDRYLLCSDGLTDVVGDQEVHKTLSTVTDADAAVRQLIALANANGGPDNITCIVADVIDTDAEQVPSSRDPIFAGAASGGDIASLVRTARAAAAVGTGHASESDGPGVSQARHNGFHSASARGPTQHHDHDDDGEPRRRWPLVTSILLVLVLLIVGGLYVGYRVTQSEYYVASDGSQVIIYRGISQKIAWISLNSVYAKTGIPVAYVPADLSLPTTPTTLAKAKATVQVIDQLYTSCQQAQARLQQWEAKYGHQPAPAKSSKAKTKRPAPKIPPKPTIPLACPSQAGR